MAWKNLEDNKQIVMTVDNLRAERKEKTVSLVQFYEEYKNETNLFFAFVEGKDDPSLYRNMINSKLPEDKELRLYPVDGKDNVKYIYSVLDWSNYSKKKVIFLMDRDLSDLIPEPNFITDINIYVTDKYAIENEICCDQVLNSVMQEVLGFQNISLKDIKRIDNLFNHQIRQFEVGLLEIMANIVWWKRNKVPNPSYHEIKVKNIIKIENGIVSFFLKDDILEYIYKTSGVDKDTYYNDQEISNIVNEIISKKLTNIIVRGKYMSEFFCLFLRSLYKDYNSLGIKPNKKGRQIQLSDIMDICAPRKRIIPSLSKFIDATLLSA